MDSSLLGGAGDVAVMKQPVPISLMDVAKMECRRIGLALTGVTGTYDATCDSVDSGVCPSPACNYDEAFPPLGDCSFPLVIETNWTDAAADGSNEEEEGRNTTNLLDRGTTRLDSITPAHTNALDIIKREDINSSAGTAPFTREWSLASSVGLTESVAAAHQSAKQQFSLPDFSSVDQPRFVVHKCSNSTSSAAFKVGSNPSTRHCVWPLEHSYSQSWQHAVIPSSADEYRNNGGDTVLFTQPRFIIPRVATDKVFLLDGTYIGEYPASPITSALPTTDAMMRAGCKTIGDSSTMTANCVSDFFEGIDDNAMYDAERLVPSPVANDASGYCAPKVLIDHSSLVGNVDYIYRNRSQMPAGFTRTSEVVAIPVSPNTHFQPIKESTTRQVFSPHQADRLPLRGGELSGDSCSAGDALYLCRPSPVRSLHGGANESNNGVETFSKNCATGWVGQSGSCASGNSFYSVWPSDSAHSVWEPSRDDFVGGQMTAKKSMSSVGEIIENIEDGRPISDSKSATTIEEEQSQREEDDILLRYVGSISLRSPIDDSSSSSQATIISRNP